MSAHNFPAREDREIPLFKAGWRRVCETQPRDQSCREFLAAWVESLEMIICQPLTTDNQFHGPREMCVSRTVRSSV
jgi:hypothetical protein